MEQKTEIIKIRVTPEEKQAVQEKAAAAKMPVSKFILTAASNRKVCDYSNLLALVREVNYIGNNINQATRIMNTYHVLDGGDFNYLNEEFLKLKKIIDEYIKGELSNGGR